MNHGHTQCQKLQTGIQFGNGRGMDLNRLSLIALNDGFEVRIRGRQQDGIFQYPQSHERCRQQDGTTTIRGIPERNCHGIDKDLVGQRIQVRTQDSGHVVTFGEITIHAIGYTGHETSQQSCLELMIDNPVGNDGCASDATHGNKIGRGLELLDPR